MTMATTDHTPTAPREADPAEIARNLTTAERLAFCALGDYRDAYKDSSSPTAHSLARKGVWTPGAASYEVTELGIKVAKILRKETPMTPTAESKPLSEENVTSRREIT